MRHHERAPVHFPVMAGAEDAARAERIAGITEQVWGDAAVTHHDVEPLLRQWLALEHLECTEDEFASLCEAARDEVSTSGGSTSTAHRVVHRVFDQVRALEQGS